jgi:hypothetical protein
LEQRPTNSTGLGMTAKYTHTRPETLRQQVEQALRRWPAALKYALERAGRAGCREGIVALVCSCRAGSGRVGFPGHSDCKLVPDPGPTAPGRAGRPDALADSRQELAGHDP